MASGESSDKKIIRIGGKLSEHFAFLNADAPSDGAAFTAKNNLRIADQTRR